MGTKFHFDNEEWKTIPSLPEFQASSLGRIRCRPITRPMPHGGTRTYGGQARLGIWNEDTKRFCIVFRGKNYKVHRLICEAFHGPAPDDKPNCLHLDEDSSNNRPENLAWGSQKENLNAPGFIEYCKSRTGEASPSRKGAKRCRHPQQNRS